MCKTADTYCINSKKVSMQRGWNDKKHDLGIIKVDWVQYQTQCSNAWDYMASKKNQVNCNNKRWVFMMEK